MMINLRGFSEYIQTHTISNFIIVQVCSMSNLTMNGFVQLKAVVLFTCTMNRANWCIYDSVLDIGFTMTYYDTFLRLQWQKEEEHQ